MLACLPSNAQKNLILANNIASIRFADFFSATLPGMLLSVLAGFIFMYFRYRKTMWGARELDLEQLRSMGVVKRKETLIKTGIAFGTVLALMFLTPLHAKVRYRLYIVFFSLSTTLTARRAHLSLLLHMHILHITSYTTYYFIYGGRPMILYELDFFI